MKIGFLIVYLLFLILNQMYIYSTSLPRNEIANRLYILYSPDRIIKIVEIKDIVFNFFYLDVLVNQTKCFFNKVWAWF